MRPDETATTVALVDRLARVDESTAAAFARTLCDIRNLPEIVTCPECEGIGIVPTDPEMRGPWVDCDYCHAWGHIVEEGSA